MRALLCGGGTAGHVMPAIAIAEIIEDKFSGSEIAFAGRYGGAENDAYKKTRHTLYTLDICGISRSLSLNNAKSVVKIIKAGKRARKIIKEFSPDVIIGTGGYVCYPFLRQGQRMGIKTVMHESNVAPGLVTRILGPKCDKLLLNLEGTRNNLRKTKNTAVVGNPTRKSFSKIKKSEARERLQIPSDKILIVSFGGSLGADMLNEAVLELIERYELKNENVYHIHATGRSHFKKCKEAYRELFNGRNNVRIVPYIEDMPTVLKAADIAITRSGAITISELLLCRTPSILIPSPNVTANHQFINAEYMKTKGAAVLIEEKDLTPEVLYKEVSRLITSKDKVAEMSDNARRLSRTNTDGLIAKALRDLFEG